MEKLVDVPSMMMACAFWIGSDVAASVIVPRMPPPAWSEKSTEIVPPDGTLTASATPVDSLLL